MKLISHKFIASILFLQTLDEARRSLATVENELRKEKLISRRYQVAVERLMQFVEVQIKPKKIIIK